MTEHDPDSPDSGIRIRLDQFLKFLGVAPTGGQAKLRIQAGDVRVNGRVETHRGRTLNGDDVVEVDGRTLRVAAELGSSGPSAGEGK